MSYEFLFPPHPPHPFPFFLILFICTKYRCLSFGVYNWRTVTGYTLSSVITLHLSLSLSFFFCSMYIQAHVIYWIGNHICTVGERRLRLV